MTRKTTMLIAGAAVVAIGGATVAMTLTGYDLSWHTTPDAGGVTFAEGVTGPTGDEDVYNLGSTVGQVDANVPFEMEGDGYTLNAGFWPGSTQILYCPGDINGDGMTGFPDLLLVLSNWGPCPDPPLKCPADIAGPFGPPEGDGDVGFQDMLVVLSYWGCGEVEGGGGEAAPAQMPIEEILAGIGVEESEWNQFLDVAENGAWDEQDRWLCWLKQRLSPLDEAAGYYFDELDCPGADPMAGFGDSVGGGRR